MGELESSDVKKITDKLESIYSGLCDECGTKPRSSDDPPDYHGCICD